MNRNLTSIAGFTIEQKLLEELRQVYNVIPMANIRTDGRRGPAMEGPADRITLPDALILGRRRGGLDINAKSEANKYFNWDRLEHGIDEDSFQAYCRVSIEMRMPVYILIAELDTGDLLMADLDTLRSSGRPRPGRWPDGKKSVNWDRKTFAKIGTFAVRNNDLRYIEIAWDRPALDSFVSQLAFDFADAA